MSSAWARAAASTSSATAWASFAPPAPRAPTGSGGSWSKEKASAGTATLDKVLRLLALVTARDDDGTRILEAADGADDPALRLLDHAAALWRLVLHLLEEHLGPALRHVAQDLLLDLLGDAAERHREVLLVHVLQHELDAAVVELDDVLEDEQEHLDLLGELRVFLGERVDHVALGAAVGRVEDVREALHAAGGRVVLRCHERELAADDLLHVLDHVRTRLAHRGDPHRHVGLHAGWKLGQHLSAER